MHNDASATGCRANVETLVEHYTLDDIMTGGRVSDLHIPKSCAVTSFCQRSARSVLVCAGQAALSPPKRPCAFSTDAIFRYHYVIAVECL
jgi:hypothetical protein